MRIVIGGQVEKQRIADVIAEKCKDVQIVVKSDIEAAADVRSGIADYYFGACHTGGGAIAMPMALLGRNKCATISSPGKPPVADEIKDIVKNGKKAFGFTSDHLSDAVSMLLDAIRMIEK